MVIKHHHGFHQVQRAILLENIVGNIMQYVVLDGNLHYEVVLDGNLLDKLPMIRNLYVKCKNDVSIDQFICDRENNYSMCQRNAIFKYVTMYTQVCKGQVTYAHG